VAADFAGRAAPHAGSVVSQRALCTVCADAVKVLGQWVPHAISAVASPGKFLGARGLAGARRGIENCGDVLEHLQPAIEGAVVD
jgi:hypothetical protein